MSPTIAYLGLFRDSLMFGSLGLGLAYYPGGNALKGLRLSAEATPGILHESSQFGNSASAFYFNARGLVGYNWIWRDGFSIGLAGGLQYIHAEQFDSEGAINLILPAIDFNIGFTF